MTTDELDALEKRALAFDQEKYCDLMSPVLVNPDGPALWSTIASLRRQLAETALELKTVYTDYFTERELRKRYQQERAQLSDTLNGEPCAEIRWQDERVSLRSEIASLRRQRETLKEALEPFAKLRVTRFMGNGLRYEFRVDAAWVRAAASALASLDQPADAVKGEEE
jgi:hypothetical protein